MKESTNLFSCLHIGRLFFVAMTFVLLALSGCKKGNEPPSANNQNNDPDPVAPVDPVVVNPTEVHSEAGMYVGITGFGENVSFYKGISDRYNILSESTIGGFTSFVNNLRMTDATVLYYAVDNNLDYLPKCKFPDDLSSVSIVTFTDGLNQGSRALDKQDGNHDYASNDKNYVNAVNNKLKTRNVQGLSINAYTIGIRGKDVQGDAVATFKDNLMKLSSSPDNATEVSNMDEVNAKFKDIAKSLYKENISSSMSIIIPMPSEGESERFTFDDVTEASQSKCYIEGVYVGEALSNVVYIGCSSTAGDRVSEKSAGGVRISFEFTSLVDKDGNAVGTDKMQQWHKSGGAVTWVRNSEFRPQESTTINIERKSAVIMLILDCSSSLGNDFAKVKEAANNFLKILVGKGEESGSGNNPNPSHTSVQSVSLSKTSYAFTAVGQTVQLSATILPANATYSNITWQSSDGTVATVSSDGLVTCKGFGNATITATVDGKSATCAITANEIVVQSVTLSKTSHTFTSAGQTLQLTFTVSPSNATYKDVTWQTSNASAATVSSDGLVTCKGFGNANITLTIDGKSASCTVLAEDRTVTDACDNKYKFVTIGTQIWMAENMRCNKYDTESERAGATLSTSSSSTYTPYYTDGGNATTPYSGNLTSEQRSKLGYLYNWAAAVGLATESAARNQTSDFSGKRQGICPNGWHVPTSAEWNTLRNYVGSSAGTKLKTTSGWYNGGNGTDAYSFAALPAGYARGNTVIDVCGGAYFWATTPYESSTAFHWYLFSSGDYLGNQNDSKYLARSVRCIRN